MKKDNKGNIFLIIVFLCLTILVLLFPKINSFLENNNVPSIENVKEKDNKESKSVTEDVLNSLHYPIMRTTSYNIDTYYKLEKFKVSDMTNADILYNAFLDVYDGNMTSNGKYGCTNSSKKLSKDYIELRIKNILGKNIKYTLESFYVPEDSESNYKGNWIYDSKSSNFIYSGLCKSIKSNISYYDLEQFIKVEYNDDDIIVYKYVGFAKIENDNYILYSDALMKNKISSGKFKNIDELKETFNNINNNKKKIYKYVFKNNLCSYNEYCLYEGKWTNEL